jgi:hypothetical protein
MGGVVRMTVKLTVIVLVGALVWGLTGIAQAQAPALSVGSASGAASSHVDLSISFTVGGNPTPTDDVSSAQLDLALPSLITYASVVTEGPATVSASKIASANMTGGYLRVLIFGLNRNVIASGQIATVRLNISGSLPPNTYSVGIAAMVLSDADGEAIIGAANAGSITVLPDVTPPLISSVGTSGVSQIRATVFWVTNEAADSQVEYGLTTGYGNTTTLNTAMVTSHSEVLRLLQQNRTYHYRVRSRDPSGNPTVSGDFTFDTELLLPPANVRTE